MNGNGHDTPSRLDRIEAILEVLVNQHKSLVEEHQEFAREHRQLLTAQVVLTDRVDKLTISVGELREAQKHTDERLNALIQVVDDLVRRTPPAKEAR